MLQQSRINLLLLSLNILALIHFIYPFGYLSLIIFVIILSIKIPLKIKYKIKLITILSLISSYLTIDIITQISSILALGLAINTTYQLDLPQSPSILNTFIGISYILSQFSSQIITKNTINRDITLLIFTLPNIFLSYDCTTVTSKKMFLISPIFMISWQYAVGFTIGIYTTSLISIEKYVKFFIISAILFIEYISEDLGEFRYVLSILSFVRGLMVYTEKIHFIEKYFLYGYVVGLVFFQKYIKAYLFIGYLIIAVILYQDYNYKKQYKKAKKDQAIQVKDIQMQQMQQIRIKAI